MSAPSTRRFGTMSPPVFIILALLALGMSYWGVSALSKAKAETGSTDAPTSGFPPANVLLASVEMRISQNTHRVIGTLRAKSRSKLAARESGAVTEILVDEGDTVAEGDVIARIDPLRMEAQITEAQATATAASALVQQREAEKQRFVQDLAMKEELFAKKATSESVVLDARRASRVATALITAATDSSNAAKARYELMKVRRNDLEIRAPFPGRIVSRHTEVGEWLNPGDVVVTLISMGEMEAWLQVPERYAGSAQGQNVVVRISATGQVVTSTKLVSVPEVESGSLSVQMIASLPNPDNALVSGLSVSAEVPVTTKTERLAIPVNAVVQSFSGPGVFVPVKKGDSPMPLARRIPIEVLYQQDGFVFIRSKELLAGDKVIVEGNERLFPFQPLAIQAPGQETLHITTSK